MTTSDARHVAAMMAASLNAVRAVGLVWRKTSDNVRVFSEPGHFDGWHDLAAIEYDEIKDCWSVVGAENEPQPDGDPLDIPWYPMPEDTIGGWCVMTTPDPPSTGRGFYIADFIAGPEIAQHIADLHNARVAGPWTADNVPPDLLKIISDAAGKAHKQGGAVAGNLANVLNAYDAMKGKQ